MKAEQALITSAVNAWKGTIERADRAVFAAQRRTATKGGGSRKNRLVYLWGHLTAVHDRMLPLLSLSERLHPEFDELFLSSPDKAVAYFQRLERLRSPGMRSIADCSPVLKASQRSVAAETRLRLRGETLQGSSRNRFAILLSRTSHIAFHLDRLR